MNNLNFDHVIELSNVSFTSLSSALTYLTVGILMTITGLFATTICSIPYILCYHIICAIIEYYNSDSNGELTDIFQYNCMILLYLLFVNISNLVNDNMKFILPCIGIIGYFNSSDMIHGTYFYWNVQMYIIYSCYNLITLIICKLYICTDELKN
jgi:hypothetical protein